VIVPFCAAGASFTAVIMMETVAILESPLSSLARKVKESVPE